VLFRSNRSSITIGNSPFRGSRPAARPFVRYRRSQSSRSLYGKALSCSMICAASSVSPVPLQDSTAAALLPASADWTASRATKPMPSATSTSTSVSPRQFSLIIAAPPPVSRFPQGFHDAVDQLVFAVLLPRVFRFFVDVLLAHEDGRVDLLSVGSSVRAAGGRIPARVEVIAFDRRLQKFR